MVSRKIFATSKQGASPGQFAPFPAPVKGLNTRDSVQALQPDEARVLVNWLPDQGCCRVRPGYSGYSDITFPEPLFDSTSATFDSTKLTFDSTLTTATGPAVRTLVPYQNGATNTMIVACNGKLWNVTGGTATALALPGAGYLSDYWSTDYLNGYIFAVNGVDTPWRFNGTTVSNMTFTGATLANLRTVKVSGFRAWFTQNNSGDVYYGPQLGVTGALSLFQISQIADGGNCLAVFPWQTYTCFFMSTGQVLVYSGDPTTDITLATKYYAPPLIEPDSCVKMGGELIAITTAGPISMDVIASGNAFNLAALGDWGKIAPSWKTDYAIYGSNLGWWGRFLDGFVYLNVPLGTNATSKQYVWNTKQPAWTTYNYWPCASLAYMNGVLYMGSSLNDGAIYEVGGGLDNGNQITAQARPGFSYMGSPGTKKTATAIKPEIYTAYSLTGQFQIDTDFNAAPFNPSISLTAASPGTSTPWGSAWGSAWSTTTLSTPKVFGCYGEGHALSAVIQTQSSGNDVQWFSTDVLVTGAGAL